MEVRKEPDFEAFLFGDAISSLPGASGYDLGETGASSIDPLFLRLPSRGEMDGVVGVSDVLELAFSSFRFEVLGLGIGAAMAGTWAPRADMDEEEVSDFLDFFFSFSFSFFSFLSFERAEVGGVLSYWSPSEAAGEDTFLGERGLGDFSFAFFFGLFLSIFGSDPLADDSSAMEVRDSLSEEGDTGEEVSVAMDKERSRLPESCELGFDLGVIEECISTAEKLKLRLPRLSSISSSGDESSLSEESESPSSCGLALGTSSSSSAIFLLLSLVFGAYGVAGAESGFPVGAELAISLGVVGVNCPALPFGDTPEFDEPIDVVSNFGIVVREELGLLVVPDDEANASTANRRGLTALGDGPNTSSFTCAKSARSGSGIPDELETL